VRHSVMEVRAVPSRSGISREVSPLPERAMTLPLRAESGTSSSSRATSSAIRTPE